MKSITTLASAFLLGATLLCNTACAAATTETPATVDQVRTKFLTESKRLFKREFPLEKFTATDAPGVYQAAGAGGVIYYLAGPNQLIFGELVTMEGKNLTKEVKDHMQAQANKKQAEALKTFPLDKAIKVGKGKKVVIEITDPDCPYCRRAADYLDRRNDLTRYVFLAPLAHPQAAVKVQHILAAKKPEAAFLQAMKGELSPQDAASVITEREKALASQHMDLARNAGVNGTPTFLIDGQLVVGADIKALETILGPIPK